MTHSLTPVAHDTPIEYSTLPLPQNNPAPLFEPEIPAKPPLPCPPQHPTSFLILLQAASNHHNRQKLFGQRTREQHPHLHPFTGPRIHQGTAKDLALRNASTGLGLGLMNQVWVCVTACLIHSCSTLPALHPLCFLSRNNQMQMVPRLQSS